MLTEVLNIVNEGRKALDLHPLDKLPKGVPASNCGCVIARCFLGSSAERHSIYLDHHLNLDGFKLAKAWGTTVLVSIPTHVVTFPAKLTEFIRKFDRGQFPELIDMPLARESFFIRSDGGDRYWWSAHFCSLWSDKYFASEAEAEADLARWLERYHAT